MTRKKKYTVNNTFSYKPGMKTRLIAAICRNFNRYNISRKGHDGWACSARRIFNFKAFEKELISLTILTHNVWIVP